jgi:protocatechuate 3,4-dioxygenase beta subunit
MRAITIQKPYDHFLQFSRVAFLVCCAYSLSAQTSSNNIAALKRELNADKKDFRRYFKLYSELSDHYNELSTSERKEIRELLRQCAPTSEVVINTPKERGMKIQITGTVVDEKGQGIPNVSVSIFQADSRGYYAPPDSILKRMSENDPRVFGFVKSDASGKFKVSTIRPSNYPTRYEGRLIPEHIHFNFSAVGYENKNIQLVFSDDEAIDEHWTTWAKQLDFPMVTLDHNKKIPQASFTVRLKK